MTDQAFAIREKLATLEQSLLAKDPGMPGYLREIHKLLKADPDVVTLLTEEECSVLVRGLKQQTKTEIATSAKKTGTKKSMKTMQIGTDL